MPGNGAPGGNNCSLTDQKLANACILDCDRESKMEIPVESWRIDYNHVRPHSALATRRQRNSQRATQMWKTQNAFHIRTAPTTAASRFCS